MTDNAIMSGDLAGINAEALLTQLYNQPLLASDAVADYLRAVAGQRYRFTDALQQSVAMQGFGFREERKPYEFKEGVATISVRGVLMHRANYYYSFATGYDALKFRHDMAQDDPEVEGIAWDFSSGGGMVSGLLDFADELYAARNKKPAIAIVNDHAYSAAYALASSVGNIHVTRSGGVGSIGALAVLWNFSKALKDEGIQAEVIRSAARKGKPNAIEPLEDEDRNRIQADIDNIANIFVAMVERNTGVPEATIRSTEAATLRAEEAIELGLAHKITSAADAVQTFKAGLAGSTTSRGFFMDTQTNASEKVAGTFTQADLDAASTAAKAQGLEEGKALGAQAENERIMGILALEEAKGREASAMALAKQPGMTVETAKAVLATVPAASANKGESLSDWMGATGGGANVPDGETPEDPGAPRAASINIASVYDRRNNNAKH